MLKKMSFVLSLFLSVGCVARNFGSKAMSSEYIVGEPRKVFKNYNSSIMCDTSEYFLGDSIETISKVVNKAKNLNLTLKVVSHDQPHSYSEGICPKKGGIVLNVEPLNKVLSTDLKAASPTVVVQPGILIPDLQKQLDPLGFTFPVSPDYNGVTIAGAMGSGAHHSSLKIQSGVADWVEEMTVVNGLGELVRLAGDDLNNARVHLGLMGVIVELKVKVVPQYKLIYVSERKDDYNIASEIEGKIRAHDFARVRWFPTQKKYVLDGFDKVSQETPGESFDTAWSSVPDLTPLGDAPTNILNNSKFASCSAEFLRANTYFGSFENVGSAKGTIVGKSHQMIAGGCEKGKCPWNKGTTGRTLEVAFPVSELKNWIQDVRSILDMRSACFPINGLYLRFSKASNGALSQAYGADTVTFEIHIAVGKEPALEIFSDVYDEIVQMSLAKYKGRPHWGKNNPPIFSKLGPAQFPNWAEFETLRKKMDPDGIFVSKLWQSVLDSQTGNSPIIQTEKCGINRKCYCTIGSTFECGANSSCVEGGFFKEAKVCKK